MASSYSSSWARRTARMYWLPPGGIGNGLVAHTWAELIDTGSSDLILVLDTLHNAGIAAYAARTGTLGRLRAAPVFRIWVDTWERARAEDVIRPALLRYRRTGEWARPT
jgi:hypothetical protein